MSDLPFACCEHCDCPSYDREGHDDSCRHGCNDKPRAESRVHAQHDAAQADLDIRAELTDRLTRIDASGDGPFHRDAALGWLAWEAPDALNEALDNTGAPE